MASMKLYFVVPLVAALLLTPLARSLARRMGAVDDPDGKRKLHSRPVPLWGGVAVYLALVAGLFVARLGSAASAPFDQLTTTLMLACGLVCLVGCVDDWRDLNARFKLLLQVAAVLPVVLAGYYFDRVVAFGYPIDFGWVGIPLTILWLVGCINALNLLDGLDGLAAVVGVSAAVMMAIIAANTGHPHVAVVAVVLAGALSGFLVYNLPPASIFLGDSGSMVIGLVVGMISIQGALKTSATLSITVPAVVMSIPMLDTVLAIVRRKLSGKSFDTADRGHIHHRLLDRGLSDWQALCTIGALCLATGAAATAATIFRYDALAWVTALGLFVLLVRTRAFGHHEVALVKETTARQIERAVAFLMRGMRRLRGGQPAELSWDEAWRAMIGEVARPYAAQLDLRVEAAEGPAVHYAWRNRERRAPIGAGRWTLVCTTPDGGACELVLAGMMTRPDQSLLLPRVAELMATLVERATCEPTALPPPHLDVGTQIWPANLRRRAA